MSSLEIVLAELETAIENADAARRNGLLRRFTDQLTEQVDVLDEEKIEVYDEVIFNLAHDIEFHARIELAEALADLERGPLRTIRDLAFDDRIAVAAPVIRRSPRLSEEDTLQIAREKGQDHLLVLSERRNLSEAVTDVIVDRGHYPVHRCLARNETARFSGQAMEKLAHSADDDRVLAEILTKREDIPPTLTTRIVERARALAAENIARSTKAVLRDAVGKAVNDGVHAIVQSGDSFALVGTEDENKTPDDKPAAAPQSGKIDEYAIAKLVIAGDLKAAMRHIATITQLPLGYVVCLFSAASIDPLIDILKVARFHWTAAEPIIARRLGRQHKGQMEQAEVAFHARDRRGAMQRIGTGLREFIASKRRAQEKQDTVAEKKIA